MTSDNNLAPNELFKNTFDIIMSNIVITEYTTYEDKLIQTYSNGFLFFWKNKTSIKSIKIFISFHLLEIAKQKIGNFSLRKFQKILRDYFYEQCKIEGFRDLYKTIKIYQHKNSNSNKSDEIQIKIFISISPLTFPPLVSFDIIKQIEFILLQQDCDQILMKTKLLKLMKKLNYDEGTNEYSEFIGKNYLLKIWFRNKSW